MDLGDIIPLLYLKNMSKNDFIFTGTQDEKIDIFDSIEKIIDLNNLKKPGYRLLTNVGEDGHQEVQHLHFHILGGQPLGSFIKRLELG